MIKKIIKYGLFLTSLLAAGSTAAADQQKQLSNITQQIQNIKNILEEKHTKVDALQKNLNQIDTQYGQASQNREQTRQQIVQQKTQIAVLEKAAEKNQGDTQKEQKALADQLRFSYFLQRQGRLKLLLNQQDFSQFSRSLYYYQTLNQYRAKTIHQLHADLQQIFNRRRQIYAQYQGLRKLEGKQEAQQHNLTTLKLNQTQLITQINQTIHDQNQQLVRLSANKKRLEQTLAHLARLKTVKLPANYSSQPFAVLKGRLPWPAKGNVLRYYNTPIEQSELKWTGELIEAPDEQPVYAVANGTVVFAKWLEGYGLLLILNHGNGYMTLYGRNHSLYKREGTFVKAGELIATVGQSGGYSKPALYFAIRHNAKPLNPNQWCAG